MATERVDSLQADDGALIHSAIRGEGRQPDTEQTREHHFEQRKCEGEFHV